MATHCAGKQGTHLRIGGGNIATPVEIIKPYGGIISTLTAIPARNTSVTWEVFVSNNGSRPSIGRYGKWTNETFTIQNTYNSRTRRWTAKLYASPNPRVRALWSPSAPSSITSIVYRAGELSVPTYSISITSPGGANLFGAVNNVRPFTAAEIECGCDDSDCQRGTFPTDFCCTNCAEQSGILSGILGALRGVG